jgi:hypothetical protein
MIVSLVKGEEELQVAGMVFIFHGALPWLASGKEDATLAAYSESVVASTG